MDAYNVAKRELEAELGIELDWGYIGNLERWGDDRLWSANIKSLPVPTHIANGLRGPWSHRASGNSYPSTRSWVTADLPPVEEFKDLVRARVAQARA